MPCSRCVQLGKELEVSQSPRQAAGDLRCKDEPEGRWLKLNNLPHLCREPLWISGIPETADGVAGWRAGAGPQLPRESCEIILGMGMGIGRVRVSALSSLSLRAPAWDGFGIGGGLEQAGLSYPACRCPCRVPIRPRASATGSAVMRVPQKPPFLPHFLFPLWQG